MGLPPDDWPLRALSRQVRVRPHDWHIQQDGTGPDVLLIHGTGASTHSWRYMLPLLSRQARVTAVDLPGHGSTRLGNRMRSSLSALSDDLVTLCTDQGIAPSLIVGHSAGAAIGLRVAEKLGQGARLAGINPALHPFEGLAGVMFPVAARMMAMTPGLARQLARQMRQPGRVLSLLRGTGSDIPASQMNLYARLFRDTDHVEGTLLMLAQWSLDGLLADLPGLDTHCLFLTGSQDRMVPPVSAVHAAARMKHARVESLDGYGHLVHEEAPQAVAEALRPLI